MLKDDVERKFRSIVEDEKPSDVVTALMCGLEGVKDCRVLAAALRADEGMRPPQQFSGLSSA